MITNRKNKATKTPMHQKSQNVYSKDINFWEILCFRNLRHRHPLGSGKK